MLQAMPQDATSKVLHGWVEKVEVRAQAHIKDGRGGERRDGKISLGGMGTDGWRGGMGTDGWRGVQSKNEEKQTRCTTSKREEV